jgi:hypothetical protein
MLIEQYIFLLSIVKIYRVETSVLILDQRYLTDADDGMPMAMPEYFFPELPAFRIYYSNTPCRHHHFGNQSSLSRPTNLAFSVHNQPSLSFIQHPISHFSSWSTISQQLSVLNVSFSARSHPSPNYLSQPFSVH